MKTWVGVAIVIAFIIIVSVLVTLFFHNKHTKDFCEQETYPKCDNNDNMTFCSYVKSGECCIRYAPEFNITPDCYNIKRMKEAP